MKNTYNTEIAWEEYQCLLIENQIESSVISNTLEIYLYNSTSEYGSSVV